MSGYPSKWIGWREMVDRLEGAGLSPEAAAENIKRWLLEQWDHLTIESHDPAPTGAPQAEYRRSISKMLDARVNNDPSLANGYASTADYLRFLRSEFERDFHIKASKPMRLAKAKLSQAAIEKLVKDFVSSTEPTPEMKDLDNLWREKRYPNREFARRVFSREVKNKTGHSKLGRRPKAAN